MNCEIKLTEAQYAVLFETETGRPYHHEINGEIAPEIYVAAVEECRQAGWIIAEDGVEALTEAGRQAFWEEENIRHEIWLDAYRPEPTDFDLSELTEDELEEVAELAVEDGRVGHDVDSYIIEYVVNYFSNFNYLMQNAREIAHYEIDSYSALEREVFRRYAELASEVFEATFEERVEIEEVRS